MASKRHRDKQWAEAKRKCRLNRETVRMARELGLNPRKLTKKIPSKDQPWKAPLHVWIRALYEKRFGEKRSGGRKRRGGQPGGADGPGASGFFSDASGAFEGKGIG